MKNMLKEYLGNDYSNDHLKNFCLYWMKGMDNRDDSGRGWGSVSEPRTQARGAPEQVPRTG